jgi:hypothetical protein
VETRISDEFIHYRPLYYEQDRQGGIPIFERKELAEAIRTRLITNLELACAKAKEEGLKVLNKYPDLDFYLSNIAFGKIFEF